MGYVGLATSVCLANAGYRVIGVDIDSGKIQRISSGNSPIHETGVEDLLVKSLMSGCFSASTNIGAAVNDSDITFVCVGTPSNSDGSINLEYIQAAVTEIARAIKEKTDYHLVVIKSTVVPGTTSLRLLPLIENISEKSFGLDFGFCFNPEFLREGSAVSDTLNPDAIVIGSDDERSSAILLELYRGFYGGRLPFILVTSPANAEFVKYSVNSFRAMQLSFLNSLATLCENVPGTDIAEVTKGLSAIAKIDQRYLRSGLGFGGSCFPKDLRALIAAFLEKGMEPALMKSILLVNENLPNHVLEIVRNRLGDLEGKVISILGLTFKAGTDDVRESVGVKIAGQLISAGASVRVYDPKGMENARRILGDKVEYSRSSSSCLESSECCIIATEWDEFKSISPSEFRRLMRIPLVIDGRRVLSYNIFEAGEVSLIQLGRYNSGRQASLEKRSEHLRIGLQLKRA